MSKSFDEIGEEPKLIEVKKELWSSKVLIVEVGDGWKNEEANFLIKPQFTAITKVLENTDCVNKIILYFNITERAKPSLGQVIDIAKLFSEIKVLISKKVWSTIIIVRNDMMRTLLEAGLKVVKPQRPLYTVSDESSAFEKIMSEKISRDK